MSEPGRAVTPRAVAPARPAGTWLRCSACGRMLHIEWATRSIVCACGSRVDPAARAR